MPDSPTLPAGFSAAGVHCGLKKSPEYPDLGLLLADEARPAAALFTKNRLLGAHVHLCREHLRESGGSVRAVMVNSRNANCATGREGVEDARRLCGDLARRIGCPPKQVLVISTGVIGARLPVAKIEGGIDRLLEAARPDGGADFARAIMTTDTVPKMRHRDLSGGGRVAGFAKGAGMIHPDMATMLAFLLTDRGGAGAAMLRRVADRSFHRVTVDGDTSPNDTVLLWSRDHGDGSDGDAAAVEDALTGVAQDLSRAIARDGEGATRLITVQVRGCRSEAEATLVGRTIATSPLTKTAVAGRDPNWGRILSAAGRCGVEFDAERARVWVGPAEVYAEGRPQPEREPEAHRHMLDQDEVVLGVDLAAGEAGADVWTCDLTADYVRINADYRT